MGHLVQPLLFFHTELVASAVVHRNPGSWSLGLPGTVAATVRAVEPDLATHSMVHLDNRAFGTSSMVHVYTLYTLVAGLATAVYVQLMTDDSSCTTWSAR